MKCTEDECPLPLLSLKMFELSRPRPSNTYVWQSWDSEDNEEAVSWGKHLFSIRSNSQHKHHSRWLKSFVGLEQVQVWYPPLKNTVYLLLPELTTKNLPLKGSLYKLSIKLKSGLSQIQDFSNSTCAFAYYLLGLIIWNTSENISLLLRITQKMIWSGVFSFLWSTQSKRRMRTG